MKEKERAEYGKGCIFLRNKKYYYRNPSLGILNAKSLGTGNYGKAEDIVKRDYLPLKHLETKEEILFKIAHAKKLIKKKSVPLDATWSKFEKTPSRGDIGAETLKNYKARLEKFFEWLKKNYPNIKDLAQINEDISKEYASYLWEQKLAAKTFNDYMVQLGIIFRYTIGPDAAEIWSEKVITRHTPQYHSRKELSEDELKKVFDVFNDEKYKIDNKEEMRVLFYIGAFTGLRLKDCALLKWEHVKFDRNLISVIPYKTKAKTQQRVNIPLHQTLKNKLEIAKKWRKDKNEYVLPLTAERYEKNKWRISQTCGRIFKQAGFEIQGEAEIQRKNKANDYGFSSFRHSFVSFCANAGVPMPVVQSIVGHSCTAVTRFYIHIGEASVKKAIDALPSKEKSLSVDDKLLKILEILKSNKKLTKREKEIWDILNR